MANQDKCCTIAPYFKIQSGKREEFRKICERCVQQTSEETRCLFYGFSFDGAEAHCREGYEDAEALLEHLGRINPLLGEALKIAELTRLEVHGPAEELEKLRVPLADLKPQFFTLELGFRR